MHFIAIKLTSIKSRIRISNLKLYFLIKAIQSNKLQPNQTMLQLQTLESIDT